MKLIISSAILSLSLLFAACGGTTETTNINAANANISANKPVNANANKDPLGTEKAAPETTSNNAPTLGPVYKAYCAAWEKKDEKALRNIYSSDTIQDFERQMKEDNVRSLTEFLAEDKASTALCEARNEKITGDTATAEVRTKGYPSGIVAVFVKENGEWKLTNRRPEGALK